MAAGSEKESIAASAIGDAVGFEGLVDGGKIWGWGERSLY